MNNKLPEHVIEEIEKQGLTPRPRFHFLLKRGIFWSLAALASIVGGVAFAIVMFVFFDHDTEAAKYLNQSFIEDIMLSIPYIWLAILTIFIIVAKYSVRHTKVGYKYAATKIVGAVLLINILLGLILNAFDFGATVDDFLSDTVPYYGSLVYTSKDAWTNPQKGLLGGYVVSVRSPNEFSLRDFKNRMWQIAVDPNEIDDMEKNIVAGQMVKILGVKEENMTFQAKQIFPWEE